MPGRTQARARRSRRVAREEGREGSRRSSHASMEREERRERCSSWAWVNSPMVDTRLRPRALQRRGRAVCISCQHGFTLFLFSNYLLV